MIRRTLSTLSFLTLFTIGMNSNLLIASEIDDTQSSETVGFFIRDLKICHQSKWRNMTVKLELDADLNADLVNVQEVKQLVRNFLEAYDKPADFWEVMNINLVNSISQKYPQISTLKSILSLAPDQTLNFPRESTVRYKKGDDFLKESFKFTKLNYLICSKTFKSLDMTVDFDLHANPKPLDYPDYQWVNQAMEEFFAEHPLSFSEWIELKPQLEAFLLKRFPTLTKIDVNVTLAN